MFQVTIRTRLMATAFLSSALVAAGASLSTFLLFRASSSLTSIRSSQLPLLDATKRVVDLASELALTFDDYSDALHKGDIAARDALRFTADQQLSLLQGAIESAESDISRSSKFTSTEELSQAHVMRMRLDTLTQEWKAIESGQAPVGATSATDDLDDHAMAVVVGVVGVQDGVSQDIETAITDASSNIDSVCHLSIVVAIAMTAASLAAGTFFAANLARRLIKVKDQATLIGNGHLDASIDVEGRDEIDAIAVSFNEMVRKLRGSREKLEHEAFYDPLTSLPNRAHFLSKLTSRIGGSVHSGRHDYAVYFIDVDKFKDVNDTLGHASGDDLLRNVANRLQEAVADAALPGSPFVARLGGDEFTVLMDSVAVADAQAFGEKLRSISITTFGQEPPAKSVTVTLSVGLAFGNDGVTEAKQILEHADAALYHSKRHGRNRCTLYTDLIRTTSGSGVRHQRRVCASGEAA